MSIDLSIENILLNGLENNPDKTAAVIGGHNYSYCELDNASGILASRFLESGLKGERIAFILPNGYEILLIYLACFKSGAVAMPLNRRYAAPELRKALINSGAKWLIVEPDKTGLINKIDLDNTPVEKIFVPVGRKHMGYDDLYSLLEGEDSDISAGHAPGDPAVILYTSGSTGEPKGVVHTYSSVKGVLESTALALERVTDKDVILISDPMVHISGFMETFTVLRRGGTLIIQDGFDLELYIETLKEHRPTLIITHIDIFMKLLDSGLTTRGDFSSLRGVYTGGDELPSALQKRFVEHTGLPIQLGYGMTEAIWLTICRQPAFDKNGCIGKPIDGVELRIVHKNGENLPDGEVGEIWVKGDMVMGGYWDNAEATNEVLSDGWFKTGDCAFKDSSGDYYYAGRIKDIIIRSTSNISPGEVEEVLYKHPGVKKATVIGVPDEKEGHVPVAFVVKMQGKNTTEKDIMDFARNRIASFKVPAHIYFIDELPLTSSGKIDHKKLYESL